MFVIVDSDDWLAQNALRSIRETWESIPVGRREQFAGVCGLFTYPTGEIVGTPFPKDVLDQTVSRLERNTE